MKQKQVRIAGRLFDPNEKMLVYFSHGVYVHDARFIPVDIQCKSFECACLASTGEVLIDTVEQYTIEDV